MKMATKSYKIIILLTAFVLSVAFAFGFMGANKVYAASAGITVENDAYDYFKMDKSFNAEFTQEGLTLDVNKTNSNDSGNVKTVKFVNDLIVNDLDFRMKLPADAETSFRFDLASYYVNGNPKEFSKADTDVGTEYDKVIENIINLSYKDANTVTCKLNGIEVSELAVDNGFITLEIRVEDNYLTINGVSIASSYNEDQKIYYKIKNIDNKAIATEIVLDFKTEKEDTETFVLVSVDQKASDSTNAYEQSLAIPEGQTKLTLANPRVYLNDSFYLRKEDGSYTTVKIAYNKTYTLNINACSLLGGYKNLYLIKEGYTNILLESNTTSPNEIQFIKPEEGSSVKFGIGGKVSNTEYVYEEFEVENVLEFDYADNEAPKYIDDEVAYKSFLNAYKKATLVETDDKTTSIGIGTEYEIPSMKDLVFDNVTPYEDLTTSVSYATRTTRSSATSMKFKVSDIGEYEFLVMFGDGKNTMKAEDFYVVDEEDENKIEDRTYIYGKYIFDFVIVDDADIIVKEAVQGAGFLGIKYTASKFIVEADGKTLKYELFYNPNKDVKDADAEGWVAIPQASSVTDTNYNKDGFGYDEVKKVNYNGKLEFVPTRIGSYMIKCTAYSTTSPRNASANTFISVNSKPTVVKVPSDWLENNVWSVVFLGVGSLCLIGIIVLLCIKPKEKVDRD